MKVLQYYKDNGLFWIRIFGKGIFIKNINVYPLLFSERNGHSKGLRIGKWYFQLLK